MPGLIQSLLVETATLGFDPLPFATQGIFLRPALALRQHLVFAFRQLALEPINGFWHSHCQQ